MIRIYPPAYWDLLQIRRNKTLYVEESTSVMISRDILEVRFSLSIILPEFFCRMYNLFFILETSFFACSFPF